MVISTRDLNCLMLSAFFHSWMMDVLDCVITYCERVDESASLEQKLRVINEIRCLCQNFKDLTKDAKKNFLCGVARLLYLRTKEKR